VARGLRATVAELVEGAHTAGVRGVAGLGRRTLRDVSAHVRMPPDPFELFEPTAAGILAWARTTSPTPPREDVLRHVGWLRERQLIAEEDVARLRVAGLAD
jgi:hypothetical protein